MSSQGEKGRESGGAIILCTICLGQSLGKRKSKTSKLKCDASDYADNVSSNAPVNLHLMRNQVKSKLQSLNHLLAKQNSHHYNHYLSAIMES